MAELVIELRSRVYDVLRVSNNLSTRVIGPICSGYVSFRSEVACLTTTFRIPIVEVARFVSPTYFDPPCRAFVQNTSRNENEKRKIRLEKRLWRTASFEPWSEDEIFTKRMVSLWTSRPRQQAWLFWWEIFSNFSPYHSGGLEI